MYDYRKMTPKERNAVVQARRERGLPWHEPPHFPAGPAEYLISAACYEHRPIFQEKSELTWLTEAILRGLQEAGFAVVAWVFLPNHYHVLLQVPDLSLVGPILGKLHSRMATAVNAKQGARGRRVWYRYADRLIRNERHRWVTMNYIHYNPVKHGYVDRAEEWPWSSLHEYLALKGEGWLRQLWKEYPVKDYGKSWDW